MKNIVVLIHDDAGQEARLQCALDVTRALDAHLRCVDVSLLTVIAGDGYGAANLLLADERQREGLNKTRTEQRLTNEAISWDWWDAIGSLAGCLVEAAELADLIVVGQSSDGGPFADLDDTAATVLIKAAAPILSVPPTCRSIDLGGHAMIAWNGSQAAAIALREAVPLLRLAGQVTIVEVDDGSIELHGEEAAVYLSRHGIKPQLVTVPPIGKHAAQRLINEVHERKPDYLVMGGFGHSRMRETLFGGVTRALLHSAPIPLFLAR